MADVVPHEALPFSGIPDDDSLVLRIYPPLSEASAIQRLTPEEVAEYGEEPLQLLEGVRYEYELSDSNYRLIEESGGGIVKQSANPHLAHCGALVTGLNTGKLILLAVNVNKGFSGTAALEIRPRKLGHRDHYRQMIEDITDVCVSLAMELRAPTNMNATPSPGTSSQTIHQRFAFVKALINSRGFRDALHRISTHPHQRWEDEEHVIDVRRGFRSNGKTMREIARASRRVPVPTTHPLATRLPTVPERITTFRNSQTADTKENRFVKFALESFSSFLAGMHRALDALASDRVRRGYKQSEVDARLQVQISTLESTLFHFLDADVFKNLSKLDSLPLGSPVLQRKAGYREIFQVWLKFDMAARLVWHGGEDVYGAGQRNIATLYEYWVFFKLLSIVSNYFSFEKPLSESLIEETEDGFGIKLKSGHQLAFDAVHDTGTRRLRVQFGYNRTFSANAQPEIAGSWTEKMRPDYTLSLWPCDMSPSEKDLSSTEAERQDVMVHVHFDAKYRVDNLEEIFGREADENGQLAQSQSEGRYKRDDLLKMHSYRDAIRRTHGAYVLYPGDAQKGWEEYHEILPGLGAFPLRPGNGDGLLRRFIDDVVQHVCDRATQREQSTFQNYRVHQKAKPESIFVKLPEFDVRSDERLLPPAEIQVVVMPDCTETLFNHAIEQGSLAVEIADISGQIAIDPKIHTAKYILISVSGNDSASVLVEADTSRSRIFSGEKLKADGYSDLKNDSLYLVFDICQVPAFANFKWDTSICPDATVLSLSDVLAKFKRV